MTAPGGRGFPAAIGAQICEATDAAVAGTLGGESGAALAAALSRALGRQVVAVLVFGSRARGEATPESDVDGLVFAEGDECGGLLGRSGGVELDLEVLPAGLVAEVDPAEWVRVAAGHLLHDPSGVAATFLDGVRKRRAEGPTPLTVGQRTRFRVWARRTCERIARNIDRNPALAAYQSAWVLSDLLKLYFRFRTLWPGGGRESLQYWGKHDPAHLRLWDAYGEASSPGDRLAILRQLVQSSLGDD